MPRSWLCRLVGHRTRLVFDAERSVIRCRRCPYEEGARPLLRPEETNRQERAAKRQAEENARIVAERERRAAAMTVPRHLERRLKVVNGR